MRRQNSSWPQAAEKVVLWAANMVEVGRQGKGEERAASEMEGWES